MTITWTQVPGAIQYKIYRTTAGGTGNSGTTGLLATITGGATLSTTDTGAAGALSGTASATNTTGGAILAGGLQGTTANLTGALNVSGLTTLSGGLTVTSGGNVAFQRNTTDITTTGSLEDLALGTGALFRFAGASAQTLSSIASPADGRMVTLINDAATSLTIKNDACVTSCTATNRILTGLGSDLSVPTSATVTLIYDSSDTRWRVVGVSTSGGASANQQLSNLSVP